MAKTLESIAKGVKNTARALGKTAFLSTLGLVSYLSANSTYADKYVNNTMPYTTINSTIASATSGENVNFQCTGDGDTIYQLPYVQGAAYTLNNSGVNIRKDPNCVGNVVLRGADPASGGVVYVTSTNLSGPSWQ